MPVIVIGADTPLGRDIVDALLPRPSEVRAFVTDVDVGMQLRSSGVKVAIGDVSDGSHVGGASMRAFCAVIVAEAARDDRERSFAATAAEVFDQWLEGLSDAGVTRAIWVDDQPPPPALDKAVGELVHVDTSTIPSAEISGVVARLEDAATI